MASEGGIPPTYNAPGRRSLRETARILQNYDPIFGGDVDLAEILNNQRYPRDNNNQAIAVNAEPPAAARELLELALQDNEAAMELLDKYLLKFQIRGYSANKVAKELDISVNSARCLMAQFKDRQKRQFERLDVRNLVADTLATLADVNSAMFQIVDNDRTSNLEKSIAAKAIISSEKTKYQILGTDITKKGMLPENVSQDDSTIRAGLVVNLMQEILGDPITVEADRVDSEDD